VIEQGNKMMMHRNMTKWVVQSAFIFVLSIFATTLLANQSDASAAPVVSSAAPSTVSVVGGDSVTIIGDGFEANSKVEINGISTVSSYVNAQTITFNTVATVAGSKRVTVVNSDGQRYNLENGISYSEAPPVLTSVSPNSGPVSGGQQISVLGSNLSIGKKQASQIANGDFFTCGLYDGAIYCWGTNTRGQLGDGTTVDSLTPVAVKTDGVLAGKTIKSISAGAQYACALTTDGVMACWGGSASGQLGRGSTTSSSVPVTPTMTGVLNGLSIKDMYINNTTTCVIASDSNAYCWGLNGNGQLGNGSTTNANVPVAVNRTGVLSGVSLESISVGYYSVCSVSTVGQVYCWGRNTSGELGNNTKTSSSNPVAVVMDGAMTGKAVKTVAANQSATCALSTDGLAFCWGAGSYLGREVRTDSSVPVAVDLRGELIGTSMIQIAAKNGVTCSIASNNNTYCWGLGSTGQRGDGSTTTIVSIPGPVVRSGALAGLASIKLSVGAGSSCIVASNNQVYCWGGNSYGQNGDNTINNALSPVAANTINKSVPRLNIGGVQAGNVQFISSSELSATTPANTYGNKTTTVTQYDGQTASLANSYSYTAPVSLTSISPSLVETSGGDIITISGTGFDPDTKIFIDGTISPSATYINSTTMTFVAPSQITNHTATVFVQSGTQSESTSLTYTYVQPAMTVNSITPSSGPQAGGTSIQITGSNISAGVREISHVSAGNSHTCGIYEGISYCWGNNTYGQIGDSTINASTSPVQVVMDGALSGKILQSVSVGTSFSCALATDGTVACWGRNDAGQLGNGTLVNSRVPVAIKSSGALAGKSIISLTAGGSNACVVASDNRAYCWGENASGQLGNNTTTQSSEAVPVTVTGAISGKTIVSVSTSSSFSCAVSSEGIAYCWGSNSLGQLGNNDMGVNSLVPVQVDMTGVIAGKSISTLSIGSNFACVTTNDTRAACWGRNLYGQLGNGNKMDAPAPVLVNNTGALENEKIRSINAGSSMSCAVTISFKATCWGLNTNGQLGDGTTSNSIVPVNVSTESVLSGKKITSVSSKGAYTCATSYDGRSYCWGTNSNGQFGNGTTTSTLTAGPTNIVERAQPVVSFNSIQASEVQVINTGLISAKTPPHTPGTKSVSVTRYDSQSSSIANAYTYTAPPAASSITPTSGLISGGDTITLSGSGFTDSTKVKLDDTYATQVTYIDATTITFVTPAQAKPAVVSISVENTDGAVSTLTDAFTYKLPDPVLLSLSPASGPMGGGTTVTINGSGFVADPDGSSYYQVTIGGIAATNITFVDSTKLTARTPPGTIGSKDVVISSAHTNSAAITNGYRYTAQSYAFTNTPLDIAKEETGILTITARNTSGNPTVSTTPTTVALSSSSNGGSFARNLTEDSVTRWTYTSVVIPAGQSSVNVYYKDTNNGTPVITGTVEGVAPFTQTATISPTFRFVVSGVSDPIKVGVPSSVTIRVTDKNGNQRNDYTGTIGFSSNDPLATVPQSYTMKASDYGIKTFTNGVTMGSTGEYCITAADTEYANVVKGQQCNITVQPANTGTISKLAIITPEQQITAGKFSSPITIQTQDSTNTSIPVVSDKTIYLYSPSPTGEFSNDGITWSDTLPFQTVVKAGTSSVNVYFRDATAHTTTIKAMDNASESTGGDFGWLNANQSITTGLSPPTKMRISGSQALISGQRSEYTVQLLDDAGNIVSADSDITIRVGGDTATSLFFIPSTESVGVSGPAEFTIQSGMTGTTIGFSDTTISSGTDFTTLTFTDGRPMTETIRLQDAMKDIQIVTALPSKIVVSALQTSISAGDITPVDVQIFDSTDQAAPAVESTSISLRSSSTTGQFSLTETPFSPTDTVTLSQGQTLKRVYYRDTTAGSNTLSANRAGFTTSSDEVLVTSTVTENFGISPISSTTPVATASSAFTVSSYDVYGNIVLQESDREVYLYASETNTQFATSQNGPWGNAPLKILAGQSSVQLFVKDDQYHAADIRITASDKSTLDNPDVDIRNATATLKLSNQPISSLAITSTQQTTIAGEVSTAITFEARKADGSPAIQDGSTILSLNTIEGKYISTNDASAVAITSIGIERGSSTATVYYYGEKSGTKTISASVEGTQTAASQPLTVQSAAPSNITYDTPITSPLPNAPTAAIHAVIRDRFNNAAAFSSDKTIELASSCTTGSFSVSSSNWQPVTSVPIAAGTSDATYYYKDTKPGDCTLTATIAGITAASQLVTIQSYAVDSLLFSTTEQSIKAGEKSDRMTVQLRKADGSSAPQDGSTRIELSADSGVFYANFSDSQTISTVTIADGQSSGSFYYSGTLSGLRTITATMSGAQNAAAQQVTVTPDTASKLMYTSPQQTIGEGEPSTPIHINVTDQFGNSSPLQGAQLLEVSSTCQSGTFSEDAIDWQPISGIYLSSGVADATFYYRSMVQGDCELKVSIAGLAYTTQSITITDSTFPLRIGLTAPSDTSVKGESRTLSVSMLDKNGNVSAAKVRTTVYLSASSAGQFSPNSVVFEPGETTKTVSFVSTEAEEVTLYARDQDDSVDAIGSLIDTSANVRYIDGEVSSMEIQSASTAKVGSSTPISLNLLNEYGIPTNATIDTAIELSSIHTNGVFTDASGNVVTSITVPNGQSQASAFYRQTQAGVATIIGKSTGLSDSTTSITFIASDTISEMRFITAHVSVDVGQSTTYRVGLYDEFGNVATTPDTINLYAVSNASSEVSGNGQFTIAAGQSSATFSYIQNEVGPFTITVSDSRTGSSGALPSIVHNGQASTGAPQTFKFEPNTSTLERGGVTEPITLQLLNANDQPTAATGTGQTIKLGTANGNGKYSLTSNGLFTSELNVTIPSGESSIEYYYRNDVNAEGVYGMPATGVFDGQRINKSGLVSIRYGEPTQLAFISQPVSVNAYSPSSVMTVQQQNQYGRPVPVENNKTVYLASSASTGRFASSKTTWDVKNVIISRGGSTASFYYQDTGEGSRSIIASDTLPVEPDTLLINATQQLTVLPSSNVPRQIDNFLVTNISDPQAQGTQSSVVVIARDADGYIVESYDGRVTFSSNDPTAELPDAYSFVPSKDKGVKVFTNQVAFSSVGEKRVLVQDSNGITGNQNDITVGDGNSNPLRSLVISQPESPVTIAPNTASGPLTIELRDAEGMQTIAPQGGVPLRLTSTSSTGRFASSQNGPWQNTLVVNVAEGLGYANVYYRDTTVTTATITASDWVGSDDSSLITNATLSVEVHQTYVRGEHQVQSLNALGKYEDSAYLFAHNSEGLIVGNVNNAFSSRNVINDQLTAVQWRAQWRQGVNLLRSSNATNQSTFGLNIESIQTTAGANDFYAVAETTESTFADPFSVVSTQIQTIVSPWKSEIETVQYALENEGIIATVDFSNKNDGASPSTAVVYLLPSGADTVASAIASSGFANPGERLIYGVPSGTTTLGNSYKIMAVTYDEAGNTTSQSVSNSFTVFTTPPEVVTPVNPTPVVPNTPSPTNSNKPGVTAPTSESTTEEGGETTPVIPPVTAPVTPSSQQDTTPFTPGAPDTQGGFITADQIVTAAIVATYGTTVFLGVFLVRESYKEWARIRRLRKVLKREQQLVSDKNTFLTLASHYLRTPITILDATVSMVPYTLGLQSVVQSLRTKADALLENGITSSLKDIQNPEVEKLTRSAYASIFFWLPILMSVVLTVAVTALLSSAAAGADLNDAIVYTSIIGVALALMIGFGARTIIINKEIEQADQVMEQHRAQLFDAKSLFITTVQNDLNGEIAQLKNALQSSVVLPDNIRSIIVDATQRLEQLVSKLSIVAQINGLTPQVEQFTPSTLIQSSVERLKPTIDSKQIKLKQHYNENAAISQDHGLLRYVTGTVLDNAVMFSKEGSTIDIDTKKKGHTTQISITNEDSSFGSLETLAAMFEPFNHATHENDLTVEGTGLSLYLDSLIMHHLGGTISASNSGLRRSASIHITFPSTMK
jgi:alpha-tubulin suppressor-like RCC1 family protein/signal transduction histidine kinase